VGSNEAFQSLSLKGDRIPLLVYLVNLGRMPHLGVFIGVFEIINSRLINCHHELSSLYGSLIRVILGIIADESEQWINTMYMKFRPIHV
jgi:hypothetical protein